jgi:hypothetical protein
MIFDPAELIGTLAASGRWKSHIVPAVRADGYTFSCCTDCVGEKAKMNARNPNKVHPRNYSWAKLMKGVFGLGVLYCDHCYGRTRILCAITPPKK